MIPGVKSALPDAIERLVERKGLPMPTHIDLDTDPVAVWMATPPDVRQWAAMLGTRPARRIHVAGEGRGMTFALVHISGVMCCLQSWEPLTGLDSSRSDRPARRVPPSGAVPVARRRSASTRDGAA